MQPPLTPQKPAFDTPEQKLDTVTPRKSRPLDAGTALQAAVRKSLGHHNNSDMLVCQLEDFLKHYGPSDSATKPDPDVDTCFDKVVSDGLAEAREGGQYHWAKYKNAPHTRKAQETPEPVEKVDCYPSGLKLKEPQTFEPLQAIVDCVLEFVKKDGQQETGMHFKLVPNMKLTSDIFGSNHKIDACFIAEPLAQQDTTVANRNINVPMEFKKKRNTKDRAIVHLQILGACHHIMNEDVRRMWIYGLTLEDNLCSLWYFSRSHSIKSKAFDWFKDPKSFVRVLLAFAKATPRELGIDPTVHVVLEGEDEPASFVYEVPGKKEDNSDIILYYKTLNVISETRPMVIAGRTTRIWKVVEVTDASGKQRVESAEEMVLKDVWLSKDRDTEGQNLDAIFAAVDGYVETGLKAQKQKHPTWNAEQLLRQVIQEDSRFQPFDQDSVDRLCSNLTNKAYRNLFLSKVHDWQGATCKALGENVWRDLNFFSPEDLESDYLEPTESPAPQPTENQEPQPTKTKTKKTKSTKSKDPKSTNRPSTTLDGTQPKWGEQQLGEFIVENGPRSFAQKRQSRVIYREVCTTLQNLGTVGEVVDVLCQTMDAMHILFLAGWVHRDISSNNIMAYRSDPKDPSRWAVKLADLEFSRLMVDPTRQGNVDPRTGTPYFIPVEVLNGKYLLDTFRIYSPSHNSTLSDKSIPLDESRPMQKFRLSKQSAHSNLAVQLDASTIGQDYVDNLKHFNVFPGEVKMADIKLKPRWDDVPKISATVNHNYQHDLESIWWILLWIITCRIGNEASARAMEDYFDNNMKNSKARSGLLRQFLTEYEAGLHEHILPFWPFLEDLRQSMHKSCLMRAVFGHLKIPESYSSIQAQFARLLRIIHDDDGPWRKISLQHGSNSQTQKSVVITQDPVTTNTGKRLHEATVEDPSGEDQSASKRICL